MTVAVALFVAAFALFTFRLTVWALGAVAALALWLFPTVLFVALIVLVTIGFVALFLNLRR